MEKRIEKVFRFLGKLCLCYPFFLVSDEAEQKAIRDFLEATKPNA